MRRVADAANKRRRSWGGEAPLRMVRARRCVPGALRVASYNCLAESLLRQNPQLYRDCERSALDPAWRFPRLVEQIECLHADVAGLQEVEAFDERWLPALAARGYGGLFKKRTGEQLDGVAVIWRRARLELIHAEPIEYRELADEPGHDTETAERARKHNVGLLVLLRDMACAGCELVFGTTHVLWNPKRGHVKMRQLAMFARRAAALASSRAASGAPPPAVCLAGDYNCTPGSLLHRYLAGDVSIRAPLGSEGTWDGQRPASAGAGSSAGAHDADVAFGSHALSGVLSSAYARVGEPAVTTSHGGFQVRAPPTPRAARSRTRRRIGAT